jgi:hypothetical protein
MKKTMTLLEFQKQYRNEERCIDAIAVDGNLDPRESGKKRS